MGRATLLPLILFFVVCAAAGWFAGRHCSKHPTACYQIVLQGSR